MSAELGSGGQLLDCHAGQAQAGPDGHAVPGRDAARQGLGHADLGRYAPPRRAQLRAAWPLLISPLLLVAGESDGKEQKLRGVYKRVWRYIPET